MSTRPLSMTIPATAGIGLRAEHYQEFISGKPNIGWVEVHSENYFGDGGIPHHHLTGIRQDFPLSLHGVGLSLGSTDDLNLHHLENLKSLIRRYQPGLVSEHLSWSSINGQFFNDLLPLPYTEESLSLFCDRVNQTQDYLACQILIENPSTYLEFEHSTIRETEFLQELTQRTGCGILLDINNIYVCASNHGFDAYSYLTEISPDSVKEIHLAGHTFKEFDDGKILIDTHNQRVCNDVWKLYATAIERFVDTPTLIEWDTDLPVFSVLLEEAAIAQRYLEQASVRAA